MHDIGLGSVPLKADVMHMYNVNIPFLRGIFKKLKREKGEASCPIRRPVGRRWLKSVSVTNAIAPAVLICPVTCVASPGFNPPDIFQMSGEAQSPKSLCDFWGQSKTAGVPAPAIAQHGPEPAQIS